MVYKRGLTKAWEKALPVATVVKGSSFAIISQSDNNKLISRIYYQDPELRLKECCYDHLGTTDQWSLGEQSPIYAYSLARTHGTPGDFDPCVQPRGTPIAAEVSCLRWWCGYKCDVERFNALRAVAGPSHPVGTYQRQVAGGCP